MTYPSRPPIRPVPAVRNSFGKAMLLVLLAIAAIVVLQATSGNDAKTAGYNVGYFGAAPLISGLIVGIWAKLATSRWGWSAYVWRFVLGSFLIFGLAVFGGTADNSVALATVTDAEKQHLAVDGAAVTHSHFGFTVPLPSTDFEFNADLQKQAGRRVGLMGSTRGEHPRGGEPPGSC